MDETYGIIYCITCLVNDKKYIGKTTQTLIRRWQAHRNAVRSGQSHMFVNALRKYGVDNFTCEQIDTAKDDEELDRLEMYHIAMYQTFTDRSKGYNSTIGGDSIKLTPEILAKRNASNTGKTRSEETKARMRSAQAINLARPEVKKAISDGLKGRPVSQKCRDAIRKANVGRKPTQETLDKMMATRKSNPEKFARHMKAMADSNIGRKHDITFGRKIWKTRHNSESGGKLSPEQKQASKELAAKLGYAETMRAVGKANLGRKMTDEQKKALSEKISAVWARKKEEARKELQSALMLECA